MVGCAGPMCVRRSPFFHPSFPAGTFTHSHHPSIHIPHPYAVVPEISQWEIDLAALFFVLRPFRNGASSLSLPFGCLFRSIFHLMEGTLPLRTSVVVSPFQFSLVGYHGRYQCRRVRIHIFLFGSCFRKLIYNFGGVYTGRWNFFVRIRLFYVYFICYYSTIVAGQRFLTITIGKSTTALHYC